MQAGPEKGKILKCTETLVDIRHDIQTGARSPP